LLIIKQAANNDGNCACYIKVYFLNYLQMFLKLVKLLTKPVS